MINAPTRESNTATALHPIWPKIADLLRQLSRLPGAAYLRPLARKLRAVAQPGGPIVLQQQPVGPRAQEAPLTVLSANLWHDWPRHRRQRERLEQFARLVEREAVDIALLQEVSRQRDLHADQWLAERLGMAYAYARANGHQDAIGFEEGVAVFSRFPVRHAALHHLGSGRTPFSRRLALGASLDTTFGPLDVFSVHLGLLPWQNVDQVNQLLAWVGTPADRTLSAFIGGDFNVGENSSQVSQAQQQWVDLFRHHNPRQDGTTHELRGPAGIPLSRRRLDYLFLAQNEHEWQVLDAHHLDAPGGPHSDHRAVLARLLPH